MVVVFQAGCLDRWWLWCFIQTVLIAGGCGVSFRLSRSLVVVVFQARCLDRWWLWCFRQAVLITGGCGVSDRLS